MDASHISIVATSLGLARDMGKTLLGVRDLNLVAEKVITLNEQLLKAQEALFAHNAALFELQQKYFEAREQVRKLSETVSQRGGYTLVDLGYGQKAYRKDITPQEGGSTEPGTTETPHYVCQKCYDDGRKVVLQRRGTGILRCDACRSTVRDGPGSSDASRVVLSRGVRARDW